MLALTCVTGWVLIGLVAGTIIRPRHRGPDSPGLRTTILLGITGALLGGAASYIIGDDISPTQGAGWLLPIIGAIALPSIPAFTGRVWSTV
jgi:uncharacterized membrane protein YeaQ/YmgE (transglycosylase-associated protein family)